MYNYIREKLELDSIDIVSYSPLTLAFIGDSIYELVIRTMVVTKSNTSANKLNSRSSKLAKAATQADMIFALQEQLTDTEMSVYKRGRNAKSYTKAKNATIKEYRMATGFEALMGYLYLTEQDDRMMELIISGLEKVNGR